MAGNTVGEAFRVTTFGESHGAAVGAVIDGCPSGIELCEADIQAMLDRRKPGAGAFSSHREEQDEVSILSGVFAGLTLGTPIAAIIYNKGHKSGDYEPLKDVFRPGHADEAYHSKYKIRDYRGGGRGSGRETAGRVIGGAVAGVMLAGLGITSRSFVRSIGGIEYERAAAYLEGIKRDGDSAGGVVECVITGCPKGLGEPVFHKLDADLARAVMSIGAVKGVEIGAGFEAARLKGSVNNSAENAGGILGGISNGFDIVIRAAVKPTPSIAKDQPAIDIYGEPLDINIKGRHDLVIAPRAAVVVEAMANIVIADHILRNAASNIYAIETLYGRKGDMNI